MSRISAARVRSLSQPLLLGVDIGTTHLKLGAYDAALGEIDSVVIPNPARNGSLQGELDPDRLWLAVRTQLVDMLARLGSGPIAAIGIAGMAESGFLIDSAGSPLTPMLLWHDRRGTRQAAAWRRTAGGAFAQISGVRITNVRSLAKWRWMVDSGASPEARWCGAPEWIALCLTGRWLTDSTLAVRTGALDVLKGEYSHKLLAIAGAPLDLFPPVGGSPAQAGPVRPQLARELGLSASVQVVIAGHDDIVSAYGAGGRPGDLIDSAGTAEGLVRIVDSAPLPAHAVGARLAMTRYYQPGSWALIAGAGATGALMQQVARMLGSDPARLDKGAAPSGRHSAAILKARLSVQGLPTVRIRPRARDAEVWSAVLDLVCERMARAASRLQRLAGPPTRLILIGGAARSRELTARKSHRLGLPVVRLAGVDATTRGAAALAALACSLPVKPPSIE